MKSRKISTSKFKRGSLIKYPLENIKRESFGIIKKELKETLRKNPGVYALYNRDKLVYVGLATQLYGRVHGWSKHKKLKWDKFSIFVIKNIKYLRDLETAVVRIARPKGNEIKGRVPYQKYLERILRDKVKEKRKKYRINLRTKDKEIKSLKRDMALIEEAIHK
ncbi:MAG: hypothetical protein AABY78_03645 [Nitrospirota bacterium]|jgi:hypothetical protein